MAFLDETGLAELWSLIQAEDVKYDKVAKGSYVGTGTYREGNPNSLKYDMLIRHGLDVVTVDRTFDGIRKWLEENEEEGLVFWKDGEPRCKIKRSDFGLEWPIKREA
jgi:hypothetical protein